MSIQQEIVRFQRQKEIEEAQQLVDQCKQRDKKNRCKPLRLDEKTWILVPKNKHTVKYKKRKLKQLNRDKL